jgi:hypothetical protein
VFHFVVYVDVVVDVVVVVVIDPHYMSLSRSMCLDILSLSLSRSYIASNKPTPTLVLYSQHCLAQICLLLDDDGVGYCCDGWLYKEVWWL